MPNHSRIRWALAGLVVLVGLVGGQALATPAWAGSLTFLWDGCGSCDGLANHRELDATVTAENTGH